MGTFFLSWELWQDMTFVLACLIAIVFTIGFIKLWLSNRLLRRYELLDEEKQARLSEMQRCGILIPRVNEIPFGVRAIQRGIEVDGIWISRPNTPDDSCRTSCATLNVEGTLGRTDRPRQASDGVGEHASASKRQSAASGNGIKRSSLLISETPFSATDDTKSHERRDALGISNSATPDVPNLDTGSSTSRINSNAAINELSTDEARTREGSPHGYPINLALGYGSAEVYVNTSSRRTTSGFEILPAGTLGERIELRKEFPRLENERSTSEAQRQEPRHPNKLQKTRRKRTK
ncbi:hypothetical protein K4F52_007260 [Lecanicillium sp. MT-2017a]|nr:hypothetical protein K4F52_007260 [Lecanicillium sp. MT-2017a]